MGATMAIVLIVEDEAVLARSIARSLSNLGHVVSVTHSLKDGQQAFDERRPDLALVDMELPDGDGLDLVERWTTDDSRLRVLVMTAHAGPGYCDRALELGASACVHKPMDLDDLASIVLAVLADSNTPASPASADQR